MSWLEQVGMLGSTNDGGVDLYIYISLFWGSDHMLDKNTSGQKWPVLAYNTSTKSKVSGDAANITAKMSIDGASGSALNDVNPTELEDGVYFFDLTAAETNGDLLILLPESSTSNVEVISMFGAVNTRNPVGSEVTSALTSQGLTVARAGNLDNLDLAIATAVSQIITAMTQPDTLP